QQRRRPRHPAAGRGLPEERHAIRRQRLAEQPVRPGARQRRGVLRRIQRAAGEQRWSWLHNAHVHCAGGGKTHLGFVPAQRPGDRLLVDRIPAEIGSTVTLEPVLMVVEGGAAEVGAGVSGASVTATVIAHRRGRKLRIFTYKPKKRRRRTMGYRSQLTELRVE